MNLNPGRLYRVEVEELALIVNKKDTFVILGKDQIITYLETKWDYYGESAYFLWDSKIIYRQIYELDEWITEIE